ncbi:hypothetical protein AMATHDRAFT_60616 [Amanita thiersii Skay4041]|uniref:t-SNARE coiled-coil homology domain-containing protein n=1 Tax=Amanita thiersii Skay4041 TaxID=703135 RepID=A0A2A9NI37_9AGAR|nr:hypothetical protein AMATHDRAFT_60616 [Amanita thiersii Skay4041]
MSRDRLAALRVRPSHSMTFTEHVRSMFKYSQAQRQGQQQTHELSTLNTPPAANGQSSSAVPAFLEEISSIQGGIDQLHRNVATIEALHLRVADTIDDGTSRASQELDKIKSETRSLTTSLKDRIKKLETVPAGTDAKIRQNQVALLRSKFLEAIQNYQRVEQDFRKRSKQRVERQLKIVKPDATAEEVNAVIEGGGDQIFTDALTVSTRYGESRAAYRDVQQRQQDLRKMEETLAELAQLFNDMSILVQQQDDTINMIETEAKDVEANTKQGLQHTFQAVIHARRYRKARWICFAILLIVCAVIAIVLGVKFGTK